MKHQENHTYWELDNLPNRLTILRLILVPVVVTLLIYCRFESPSERHIYGLISAIVFVLASITDYFDGLIARKKNLITLFGSFLDPIADKFLVVSSLIMLLSLQRIPDLAVIILVLREMYMTSLRLFAITEEIQVPVNNWGKGKTFLQMVSIPMLMVYQKIYFIDFRIWGTFLLYTACLLSILSSIIYSFKLLKTLKAKWRLRFKKGPKEL
jgi:CDP-diacylglycerol--glycerol-3-phosphate 3-phosphatidyltransferase